MASSGSEAVTAAGAGIGCFMSAQDARCLRSALGCLRELPPPSCQSFAPATVLPTLAVRRELNYPILPLTAGGVCDVQFRHLAGYRSLSRDYGAQEVQGNPALASGMVTNFRLRYHNGYRPREAVHEEPRGESVIFLGDLHMHFGHTLTDSLVRLWHVLRTPDDRSRLVMLRHAIWDWKLCDLNTSYHKELLRLLGIEWERLLIVEHPTRFARVVVPGQAAYWDDGACCRAVLRSIYEAAVSRITPRRGGRLYLSRRGWRDQVAGEEYFEDHFAGRGFEVIRPEQLPLAEQLALVAGAEVLAAPLGTLSHLALFARDGTRIIHLLRHKGQFNLRQLLIDALKGLESVYVDTAAPDTRFRQEGMEPTAHWQAFAASGWLT